MGAWVIDFAMAVSGCVLAALAVIPVGCWWIAKHDARMDR